MMMMMQQQPTGLGFHGRGNRSRRSANGGLIPSPSQVQMSAAASSGAPKNKESPRAMPPSSSSVQPPPPPPPQVVTTGAFDRDATPLVARASPTPAVTTGRGAPPIDGKNGKLVLDAAAINDLIAHNQIVWGRPRESTILVRSQIDDPNTEYPKVFDTSVRIQLSYPMRSVRVGSSEDVGGGANRIFMLHRTVDLTTAQLSAVWINVCTTHDDGRVDRHVADFSLTPA